MNSDFEFIIKPKGGRAYSGSVCWGGSGAHRRGEEADGDAPNIESFFASAVGSLDMLERRESCLADAYL